MFPYNKSKLLCGKLGDMQLFIISWLESNQNFIQNEYALSIIRAQNYAHMHVTD